MARLPGDLPLPFEPEKKPANTLFLPAPSLGQIRPRVGELTALKANDAGRAAVDCAHRTGFPDGLEKEPQPRLTIAEWLPCADHRVIENATLDGDEAPFAHRQAPCGAARGAKPLAPSLRRVLA